MTARHGTGHKFKKNNNSSIVIMIFLLIFISVFLTHSRQFLQFEGIEAQILSPFDSTTSICICISAGCRVCLIPVPGSSEHSCGRCTQAEKLLSLVPELQEDVGRLRCIEESERETLLILYSVISEKI